MIKKYFLISILYSCMVYTYAQEYNIYNEVLTSFTTLLDTGYNWQANKIFIEETKGITNNFPASSGRYQLVICDKKQRDSLVVDKGSIYMYRFLPMTMIDGCFVVEISGFSCKPNGITICNAGYRYSYVYDCLRKKLVFKKYNGGGI